MAGRGSFEAITPSDMERLLAQPYAERWDFTADGMKAAFGIPMDKAWVAIHCALSDGTLYGTLGDPPLGMAILGDHLICQTNVDDFLYLKYPTEVAAISSALQALNRKRFLDMLSTLEEEDEDVEALGLSTVPDDIEYILPYFEDMRRFYTRAAEAALAVLFSWG
jgi:hypothetical protein